MKNIEVKKVVRVLFYINLITISIHMLLYIIYLLLDSSSLNFIFRETIEGKIIRYSFFFEHPNVFGSYVFWTTAMYFYLYFNKVKMMSYLIAFFLGVAMYIFPNSKTSALMMFLLIVLVIFVKKGIKLLSVKITFFILLVLSILGIFYIEVPIVAKIDGLLTGRISIGKIIYDNYGVNLFGTDISKGVENSKVNGKYFTNINIIDSIYYALFLNYGIFALCIFSYFIVKYNGDKNDNIKNALLLLLIFYGISETSCLSPELAFPILFLSDVLKERLWKKKLV